jgi:copper transporter 1
MLFNWSSKNLCIIFRSWRITGPISFFFSLVAIVLLTAGYEGIRSLTRKYEEAHAKRLSTFVSSVANTGGKSYSFRGLGAHQVWYILSTTWDVRDLVSDT